MIKKIIVISFLLLVLCLPVFAEETDIYKEQLKNSGALELEENLPDETRDFLNNNSINISDYNWINNLDMQNVFSHIIDFLKNGFKKPIIALGSIVAIVLINAILFNSENNSVEKIVTYTATIAISGIVILPIFSAITAAVNAMKGCATFITAFIPVFAVITAATGKAVTSVSMSGLLLGAANAVSLLSNFAVVPLIAGYLSLSLATSISPVFNSDGISAAVKKLSLWIMSFISTVFIGILSIQTIINSSADNLSMRTAKFIVGSSVPVVGTVLSEALNTLTASMALLKSSVGIYGIVICCIIFLPIIIELLLWRLILWIADFVSVGFSLTKISGLLKSIDTVLSVLIGVILLTGAMFIISLTVIISITKT